VSRKLLKRFGERGRNRTFNLLIKSQISQSAGRVYKSGADYNLINNKIARMDGFEEASKKLAKSSGV
jgi:hypothetical protein